jgi:hypothetical protein
LGAFVVHATTRPVKAVPFESRAVATSDCDAPNDRVMLDGEIWTEITRAAGVGMRCILTSTSLDVASAVWTTVEKS